MKKTLLMGILNVTPDSFYDGGKYTHTDRAIQKAMQMMEEGADIIDIGAESTRPGSDPISLEEELKRVSPVIYEMKKLSIPFSIDTYKPEVAKIAVDFGCCMVNDITGLQSKKMRDLVKGSNIKACIMHMKKTPKTMQKRPLYPTGVIFEISEFFRKRCRVFQEERLNLKNIILDPGIGFGKTVEDNLTILRNIQKFKEIGHRVLIGLSRKSFMGKILKKKPTDLLPATIGMNTMALMGGADIIRVHDVLEHRDLIDVFSYQNK